MIQIKRILFLEYLLLEDKSEYDYYIQYSDYFNDAKNVLNIPELDELPFGFIKDYQTDLESGDLDFSKQIEYLSKIIDFEIIKTKYLDEITKTCSHMLSSIINMLEIEERLLSNEISQDEEAAGAFTFSNFGVFPQFLQLANDDITKIEQIRNMKYSDCLMYLLYKHQMSQYEKQLTERYSRKHN